MRNAKKIFMAKNIFCDNRVETAVAAEKTNFKRNTVDAWPSYGYFKQQTYDYCVDNKNMPENSIMYLNQGYQSQKDNKRVCHVDYFLVGQVNECLNPPKNLETYEFKDTKAKMFRPR